MTDTRPSGQEPTPSDNSDRILVFTATYEERENIQEFVDKVLALGSQFDLLVVDDNSPDGTGELLNSLATENPRLHVVHRPGKLGLGTAHKLAMVHAVRNQYSILVTMDADFSHDPGEIPSLMETLENNNADFATGSRYIKGGRCDYTGYRRWVSKAANLAARILLGIPLYEFTTSYRAFRISSLAKVDIAAIRSQGYSFFLESIYRIAKSGCQLAEMPIHFHDRAAGQSKIPRLEIFRGMRTLLGLVLQRWFRKTPAHGRSVTSEKNCYLCDQPYVVERFAPTGQQDQDYSAFKCTSMEHNSVPRVVACLHCGLNYVPKQDINTDLEELYADVVDDTYLENQDGRRKTFAKAWENLSKQLPEKPGRLLEIGAYCGLFLEEAQKHGWQVEGVEPSRWASQVARDRGLQVHTGTLAVDSFMPEENTYDAVIMWDVFEHVEDPSGLLQRAQHCLKDDGILCLSTLDIDNWFPQVMGKRWPWYMDMHIFYFSAATMLQFYQRAGLKTLEAETYCHYISVRYLFEKLGNLLPLGLGLPFKILRPLAPRALFIPFRFGDIKVYVGQKTPQLQLQSTSRTTEINSEKSNNEENGDFTRQDLELA